MTSLPNGSDSSHETERRTSTLHVACAADEKYVPHCAAMLHSVFATTGGADIVVHFTHFPDFPAEQLSALTAFVNASGATMNTVCVEDSTLVGLPSTEALPPV